MILVESEAYLHFRYNLFPVSFAHTLKVEFFACQYLSRLHLLENVKRSTGV